MERAHKSGVKYIAQPGGSIRDDHVIATCNKYGIAMHSPESAYSIINYNIIFAKGGTFHERSI